MLVLSLVERVKWVKIGNSKGIRLSGPSWRWLD